VNRVVIVDYGLCNIDSVRRAVEELGGTAIVADRPQDVERPDRVILPGVGAFGDAMARLRERELIGVLNEVVVEDGIPFLGICLGMQLMSRLGTEGGPTDGLGWLDASVERLSPTATDRRVPHIGWNEVTASPDCLLFEGVAAATDFYFVHSYHVRCRAPKDVAATTPYCGGFASAVGHGTVWGVQFHPEKSQEAGLRILRNFAET